MGVERFLGAAWASVHGPADPRALLTWTLEQGFRGLLAAPAPRPIDWSGVRRALRALPATVVAVRIGSILTADDRPDAGLASSHAGERASAAAAVADAVRQAGELGAQRVVLEPGIVTVPGEPRATDLGDASAQWTPEAARTQLARRNAGLERALDASCRSLHALCRQFPETDFALTASRHVFGLGEAGSLEAIFEDLAGFRLSYWHDAPAEARRCELLGESPGRGLESFGNRISGMTLGDSADGQLYLPPGAGGVDYALVSAYRTRHAGRFPVVLELDPAVDPGEISGVLAFLSKFGL